MSGRDGVEASQSLSLRMDAIELLDEVSGELVQIGLGIAHRTIAGLVESVQPATGDFER